MIFIVFIIIQEVPILSIARAQRSDEPDISSVRRNILRTRSASMSIPHVTLLISFYTMLFALNLT